MGGTLSLPWRMCSMFCRICIVECDCRTLCQSFLFLLSRWQYRTYSYSRSVFFTLTRGVVFKVLKQLETLISQSLLLVNTHVNHAVIVVEFCWRPVVRLSGSQRSQIKNRSICTLFRIKCSKQYSIYSKNID